MNLLALFLLPSVMQPLPAIMPFADVDKRERTEVADWQRDIDKLHTTEQVNNYWNRKIKYKVHDAVWSTPEETYERGTGDCRDYAVAKYYSLRHLGYTADRLKLTVVEYRGEWHAILIVDGDVLDSMTDNIKQAEDINYYHPAYSANEDNLWTIGWVNE